jgi:hypothetical protein
MHYTPRIFFSDDLFDTVPEPEDDIDTLFRNLEQVEPPPSVIERILSSVSQLPLYPAPPVPEEPAPPVPSEIPETLQKHDEIAPLAIDGEQPELNLWGQLDGLVVRREQCEPS